MKTGKLGRFRRDDRGQALVEFALIMPFLLLLLIGVVEFGRGWNMHQVLTDAAREGARKAVIFDPAITQDSIKNVVINAGRTAGFNIHPDSIVLTNWDGATGTAATVDVRQPYRFVFFGALKQWTTGQSTVLLHTRFTMRNE